MADPAAAAAAALAAAAAAANPAVAVAAVAAAAPPIALPAYDVSYENARDRIGTLPSLQPRPTHSNIRALERDLFEKLQAIQSAQSEEWGYRGLAEQPAEYALKSPTPWTNTNNPGPHRTLGLNAAETRDAEAQYDTNKAAYISQLNVTQAVINALNTAVPKQFKRGTNAAGLILGANPYRNNQDPRAILLSLRTLYGKPSPAEKQANSNAFREQWNPADPIETYFDRLEDCYVTALIASPPFTMPQMCDMAITSLQLTGLYSDALTEYERLPAAQQTWDDLKTHFTSAYNTKLIAGTQTTGQHGYAATTILGSEESLNNIEQSLNHELTNLQVANHANHQSTQDMIQMFTQQLAAVTQQLSAMQNTANAVIPPPIATAPTAPPATNRTNNTNRNQRGGRGRTRNHHVQPAAAATPTPAANSNGIPPPAVARTPSTLNYNKYYNNNNYCYSCGYDVPHWHTSDTCPYPKANHQRGCTRANVQAYEQAGHDVSKRGIHKTIMPTNPGAHQA